MSTFTNGGMLCTALAYDDAVAAARLAYEEAKSADLAFYTECVRQFGHAAPDMRYLSTAHDKQTAKARDAYRLANNRLTQAHREVRRLEVRMNCETFHGNSWVDGKCRECGR